MGRLSSAKTSSRSQASRVSSRLLLACLLLGSPGALVSLNQLQAQVLPGPTTFFVETIRIENAQRAQDDVIVTESRLETGQSYTETELQNGRNRIVQLPFIIDADISLERGSEPGRFALVVKVVEAKTWFLAWDLNFEFFSRDLVLTDSDAGSSTGTVAALVGRQFFLGRAGVLTTALGGEDGDLQFQYTQFDLFGKGIGFNIAYRLGLCSENPAETDEVCSSSTVDLSVDPSFSTWSQTGTMHRVVTGLTVPLSHTTSLLGEVDFRYTDEGIKRPILDPEDSRFFRTEGLEEIELRVAGVHDTLDDPVAPTSGMHLEVALSHRRIAGEFRLGRTLDPLSPAFDTRISELGVSASIVRYWPRGRYSLFAKGEAYLGESDWQDLPIQGETPLNDRATAMQAALGFGHATHLWRSKKPGTFANLRLETEFTADWNGTSPSSSLLLDAVPELGGLARTEANPLRMLQVRSSLVYRSRRTLMRFSLGYRELSLP